MRSFILGLFLGAFLTSSVQAAELQICTNDKDFAAIMREHTDARIRATYIRILQKAGVDVGMFSVCEIEHPLARILSVVKKDGRGMFALLLPSFMRSYSDTQLEGLIGHEVAHVVIGFRLFGGVAVEKQADAKAAEWVGKDAVIAMLRAQETELVRFPLELRGAAADELHKRIDALSVAK